MKRLTERDKWSRTVYALTDNYSIRLRLAEYEDLGFTPEELKKLLPNVADSEAAEARPAE
jgi:hypothetical protein